MFCRSSSLFKLPFLTFLESRFSAGQPSIPLPSADYIYFLSFIDPVKFTSIMISSLSILLCTAALAFASPFVEVRTVASLNQAAFEQAQQRDNTATRAFSSTEIKVRYS